MVKNIKDLIKDIKENGSVWSIEFKTHCGIREIRYLRKSGDSATDRTELHFVSPISDEERAEIEKTFDL